MRKMIVAGNWKMNKTYDEALSLVETISNGIVQGNNLESVLIFPPNTYLNELNKSFGNEHLKFGSQNISDQTRGAYTGEVSCEMLQSINVVDCLVGHSERRKYYGESNEILKRKIDLALQYDISPIYCCGETLEERNVGSHFDVVKNQIGEALFHLNDNQFSIVKIAYEPVWAIGTGETATSEQAEEMHAYIRSIINEKYGDQISEKTHILYGGSCNASNAKELFSCPNVDGGLIGGASLKADDFLSIIASANE